MKRFVVVSSEKAVENGWLDADELGYDSECQSYLFDTSVTPPRRVARDGGEPEDQSFGRSLSWVVRELNKLAEENNGKV